MRCTPIIHELIVLTLPPRHRCPLTWLPASRLLLPRSGLERSDFVLWRKEDVGQIPMSVKCLPITAVPRAPVYAMAARFRHARLRLGPVLSYVSFSGERTRIKRGTSFY